MNNTANRPFGPDDKAAAAQHPILNVLARRWSPRAFSDRPIEPGKIAQLFEAVRWSASSFNEQPWRFIVATRDQREEYARVLSCLVEGNRGWAITAPLLGLTLLKKTFSRNGKPNRVALHDVGLAMGNLSAQATALELCVHQMAGIEMGRIASEFGVPDDFEPATGFAIGYLGDPDSLPEPWMRDAEKQPRDRRPLSEFVFTGRFGAPSPLV
jgi:nitroreductase